MPVCGWVYSSGFKSYRLIAFILEVICLSHIVLVTIIYQLVALTGGHFNWELFDTGAAYFTWPIVHLKSLSLTDFLWSGHSVAASVFLRVLQYQTDPFLHN